VKGSRSIGKRKAGLIYGPVRKQLVRLSKKGINGFAYLRGRYNVGNYEDFKNVKTKQVSGIISDLAGL